MARRDKRNPAPAATGNGVSGLDRLAGAIFLKSTQSDADAQAIRAVYDGLTPLGYIVARPAAANATAPSHLLSRPDCWEAYDAAGDGIGVFHDDRKAVSAICEAARARRGAAQ